MLSAILLAIIIFLVAVIAAIYIGGIQPARLIEKWAAGLSNGGHFPDRPNVKWRVWLLPVHREMQRIKEKMEGQAAEMAAWRKTQARKDFLENCVMASLMEGVLVVDSKGIITMVNAELMNLFQLTQSPIQRTVLEAIRDQNLHLLISDVLNSGRSHACRITLQCIPRGRPPTLEVSAMPILTRDEGITGVIVLTLPSGDRLRLLRATKRHILRLDNLVGELKLTGGGEAPIQPTKESVDIQELLENTVAVFTSKPKNSGLKTEWKAKGDLPRLWADATYLEVGLVQLLDNIAVEVGEEAEVSIVAEPSPDGVLVRVAFRGGSIPEADLKQALSEASSPRDPAESSVIGSASSFSRVREIMDLHDATLAVSSQGNEVEVTISFPRQGEAEPAAKRAPLVG